MKKESCEVMDCGLKVLALKYAAVKSPQCHGQGLDRCRIELQDIHDALELGTGCGLDSLVEEVLDKDVKSAIERVLDLEADKSEGAIYVCPHKGDDANSGHFGASVRTIERGLEVARAQPSLKSTIYLVQGTHYLAQPIHLTPRDSGLEIRAEHFGEDSIVSGAVELKDLKWETHVGHIMKADVSSFNLPPLTTLYVNNLPATRARFPNGNPRTMGLHTSQLEEGEEDDTASTGLFPASKVLHWNRWPLKPPLKAIQENFVRDKQTRFHFYRVGIGGQASVFDPPANYFSYPQGYEKRCVFQLLKSMDVVDAQIEAKFKEVRANEQVYANVFQHWPWGNWVFEVNTTESKTVEISVNTDSKKKKEEVDVFRVSMGKGGFQEARGMCGDKAGRFYFENSLAFLDQENEFYLDVDSQTLYYWPNSTLTASTLFTATKHAQVIEVVGEAGDMVEDVTIQGVVVQETLQTHMHAYEVPSGGDYSVHRGGSVLVEHARRVKVRNNRFFFLGGTAVCISKGAQHIHVQGNRMKYLDGHGVVVLGDPHFMDTSRDLWDMTHASLFPYDVRIQGNSMSELGLVVKQSAGVFVALGKQVQVLENIVYNTPRTSVNFNDGFGGRTCH